MSAVEKYDGNEGRHITPERAVVPCAGCVVNGVMFLDLSSFMATQLFKRPHRAFSSGSMIVPRILGSMAMVRFCASLTAL